MLEIIHKLLTLATIGSQLVLLAGLLYFYFAKKNNNDVILNLIAKHGIGIAFLITLASILGSLYYSEIVKYPPCDLCWWQRVVMYPQIILLGVAWWRKDFKIIDTSLILNGIGFIISAYQNYIYYQNNAQSAVCNVLGSGTSCAQKYFTEFGYITIPMMAMTAFLLMFLVLLGQKLLIKKEL